jgi:hypothetical protein
MNASNDQQQRQPFQGEEFQSPPFYQTSEFRRGLTLIGVLLVTGLAAYYFVRQHAASVAETARAQANQKAAADVVPAHPLNDEEKAARHTDQLSKLEGTLSDSENGQPLVHQSPGYSRLLALMQRYTPEEIDQQARIDFDWQLVMRDPDAWRGEFMRVRGILEQLAAVKLDYPVPGHPDVWRAILTDGDTDHDHFWFVDMLDRPAGVGPGDAVDTEGVLYRTGTFQSRSNLNSEAPMLIGRTLRRIPAVVETGFPAFLREHTLPIFGALAFLVFAVALLFSAVRQGRKHERRVPATASSFGDLFDKKLREQGKAPPPHA